VIREPAGRPIDAKRKMAMEGRRRSTINPTPDPLAPDVIAAFEAAQRAGLSSRDCYLAGVRVWRRAYPDYKPEYASMKAVGVILKAKVSLRVED
jgi:hypothetical protein